MLGKGEGDIRPDPNLHNFALKPLRPLCLQNLLGEKTEESDKLLTVYTRSTQSTNKILSNIVSKQTARDTSSKRTSKIHMHLVHYAEVF